MVLVMREINPEDNDAEQYEFANANRPSKAETPIFNLLLTL